MPTGTTTQAPQGLSGPGRGVGGPGMMNMMPNMGRGMGIPNQNIPNSQFQPPQGRGTTIPMQSKYYIFLFILDLRPQIPTGINPQMMGQGMMMQPGMRPTMMGQPGMMVRPPMNPPSGILILKIGLQQNNLGGNN